MFITFLYQKLRIGEFIQFFRQVINFCNESNPAFLGVDQQVNELQKEWEALEKLFKKALGSELTPLLEEQDERRDKAITGLRLFFDSLTYHFENIKREAGRKLLKVIDKYGAGIARKNYQEESAIILGILRDWEEDAGYMQALTLLGAVDWKNELKEANEAFDLLYRQRTGDLKDIPEASATSLREPVMEAFRKLEKHLSAHATLAEDSKPYNDLAKMLNQHMEQYNQLVRIRYGNAVDELEEPSVTVETSGNPVI